MSEGSTVGHKWAIAISVQKNWKSKIEGDVKKVVETGRGYTKVIFSLVRKSSLVNVKRSRMNYRNNTVWP